MSDYGSNVLLQAHGSNQPLAVVMTRFDFMKQFPMFATLGHASGGSAPSR
jgi:GGDEF domain-containing protein